MVTKSKGMVIIMSKDKNEINEVNEPVDKNTGDGLLPIFFDENKEQSNDDDSKKAVDNLTNT